MFWRYQAGKPKEYLSTIEAIYYLCVDFQQIILEEEYVGLRKSCELNLHPPHMIITYQHQELQVI